MLASKKIVAFVPTSDYGKAKNFYADVLGLTLVSEDPSRWSLTPTASCFEW